jgi:hypothetical protein
MRLEHLLAQHRHTLIKKWFECVVNTYPDDTAAFLKNQKDPFSNPVGRNTLKGLEALLDVLLNGMDLEAVNSFLDPIIRTRAVQAFSPSEAVAFIFAFKHILREHLIDLVVQKGLLKELLALESRVDDLGLAAFDIYMECREKLNQIRVSEVKNRTFKAMARARLITEIADDEADL